MIERIALISEHASPLAVLGGCDCGGQNVYVGQLARRLAQKGLLVDVFTRRDDSAVPEVVSWGQGIRIIHVPAGPPSPVRKEELLPYMGDFARYMHAWLLQRRGRYDVVHANFFMSGLIARDIKERFGIPFVITFHALGAVRQLYQGAEDRFPKERVRYEAAIIHEADAIFAECPQDAKDLMAFYGAPGAKLRLVPCGFDPEQFKPMDRPMARRALGLSPSEPVVLHVGRMVPRKGIDTVIEAMARLRDQHHMRARLVIVGGESDDDDPVRTPEIGRLKAIVQARGLTEEVTFVGRRRPAQLRVFYNAADLFVTTPWYEPFGITPLEAMACATPVIGASVGGIKYTVRHKETGYLVPPSNPAAVALYMAHALSHPIECRALGERGLRWVRAMFTWDAVSDLAVRVYEEVAGAPRKAGTQPAAIPNTLSSKF